MFRHGSRQENFRDDDTINRRESDHGASGAHHRSEVERLYSQRNEELTSFTESCEKRIRKIRDDEVQYVSQNKFDSIKKMYPDVFGENSCPHLHRLNDALGEMKSLHELLETWDIIETQSDIKGLLSMIKDHESEKTCKKFFNDIKKKYPELFVEQPKANTDNCIEGIKQMKFLRKNLKKLVYIDFMDTKSGIEQLLEYFDKNTKK